MTINEILEKFSRSKHLYSEHYTECPHVAMATLLAAETLCKMELGEVIFKEVVINRKEIIISPPS